MVANLRDENPQSSQTIRVMDYSTSRGRCGIWERCDWSSLDIHSILGCGIDYIHRLFPLIGAMTGINDRHELAFKYWPMSSTHMFQKYFISF